jgi:hypothetical protein
MGVEIQLFELRIKSLKKGMNERQNDLLIAFIDYVNYINKLKQFKVSVQKSHHRLQCTFQLSWQQYVWLS